MKRTAPSLRLLFILTVSLITLLITVTLTYFISKQFKEEVVVQLIHHVETMAQDFDLAVTDYIITENYSSLQDFVVSYQHRPHIEAISVTTPSGVVIADSEPERLGHLLDAIPLKKADTASSTLGFKAETMLSLSPVRLDETTVGWCQLTVNTGYVDESLAVLQQKAAFWGIVTWLFAGVAATIISSFIKRPLRKIMGIAQEISSGNFGKQADVEGPQEIRQLAVAFNAMTDEIENRETLLKLSENRFRSLVEDISDWVWEINENGVYTYASPAVEQILGYSSDEVLGKTSYDLMTKIEAERVGKIFDKYFEEGSEFKSLINTKLHKNGHEVAMETAGQPFFSEDGIFKGYRGVGRDISKRQKAADERKQLEQQLQQAQKMEAIGTLAGGIAHDFNNILAAILGYSEMARAELADDDQIARDLDQVIIAGKRATELVKQILTFSRQGEEDLHPLKIQLIIKEALKLLRSSLPTTIQLKQDIADNTGLILADPTQMHQVLMNLCTNAKHAIGSKNGTLRVSLSEVPVTDSDTIADCPQLEHGSYLDLAISDTGCGLDGLTLSRIFDPFFTTKEKEKGTGLGLAVVHGIIKQHKGEITVASERGQGSTFHVYLPIIEEEVPAQKVRTEEIPRGSERILLVDDEPAIAQVMQRILNRLGYTVTAFTSSIEALAVYTKNRDDFDLVITDMTMPEMTGIALAKKLFTLRSDLPVILCTGFNETIDEKKAKSLGIREYIMKPVVQRSLAKAIRKALM